MNNGDVSIQINKEVITPILEAKIKVAMLEAFGETDTIINAVVENILNHKVDDQGNVSNYRGENKNSWVDVTLKRAIEEAAKEVILEFVKAQKEVLKKEMMRQLQTKKGISAFVGELLGGVVKSVENNWRFKTEFKFENTD